MRGRYDEAKAVLARLDGAAIDSEAVNVEMTNIKEALEVQSAGGGFKMRELLQNGPSQNFRRTCWESWRSFFSRFAGSI